jgi:hypothetical protein
VAFPMESVIRHGCLAIRRRLATEWLALVGLSSRWARSTREDRKRHMQGAREFVGQFWVADRDSARQPGVLRVAPGTAPTVETADPLISPWREQSRVQLAGGRTNVTSYFEEHDLVTPMTIHGLDASGTPLTLLDAITSHYGPHPSGRTHHFRGLQAIMGGHATGRDHQYVGFRIRLRHLDAWVPRLREMTWTSEVRVEGGGRLTFEDHSVSDPSRPPKIWLTGQGFRPLTLRGMDSRFLRPLMTIFTLATDTPCVLLEYQVQEDSPDSAWWDVFSSAHHPDSDAADTLWERARWLLQPADVDLYHVGVWLSRVDSLGPLPAVVADLAHAESISLETQVLLLSTVAEGLHRRLYPGEVRFDEQVAEDVQAAAAEAVGPIHPDAASAVRGLLRHVGEIGYGKRLVSLADAVGDAVPGVTGRTTQWKNLVYKARNEFAHRPLEANFLSDNDVDRYITVALSLRWLLTGLLLLQAGLDPSALATRFNDHEPYLRFLADARMWQPRIYDA